MVAVAEKKAEGLMAGLDNQSITLPRQGVPLVDFGYAANGVNTVGLTIIANEETLKSNPDLVRRFVKATTRSFQAALKEPEASVKAGQKVKPDMDADLAMAQLKAGIGLMASEATKSLPMGQFALKDWQDTVDLMKQYQDLQTDKAADAFFTNEFAGKSGS
jgi:NitT/TauT family transport system substrate-binding protein